jgi:aerobic-type carbon monoxide dehydrogenase small subunit (CoxS/CutS family)
MAEKEKPDRKRFSRPISRRKFIKGMGGGVVSSAALGTGILVTDPSCGTAEYQTEDGVIVSARIKLKVNGQTKQAEVEPRHTLAQVLRDELHLTGTKIVCDRGECGACTVLMNGLPVKSCSILAIDAHGSQVTTIEGLASGKTYHPVQKRFMEFDASQCGFCTPGMIMSVAALIEGNNDPTELEIRKAVSGNTCRCGTYPNVFKAAKAAAADVRKGA